MEQARVVLMRRRFRFHVDCMTRQPLRRYYSVILGYIRVAITTKTE
jgi:hypothetical protein